MKDPELSTFAAFAFLGFVLALLPLPWHINSSSAGIVALMLWVSLLCLVFFLNSVVLAAPVWCDIATKLIIGACVGAPASLLCLFRRLHAIVWFPDAAILQCKLFYSIWVDILLAFGFPIMVTLLHIVFQDRRYVFYEQAGCFPSIYPSPLSYVVMFVWPVFFSLVSMVYAGLTLAILRKNDYKLSKLLYAADSISRDRYVRLFAYSLGSLVCNLSVGIFVLYANFHGADMQPLSAMKRDFGRVVVIPSLVWRADHQLCGLVELRWLCPLPATVSFGIFVFTRETQTKCLWCFKKVKACLVNFKHRCSSVFSPRQEGFDPQFVPDGTLPLYISRSPDSGDTRNRIHSTAAMDDRRSTVLERRNTITHSSLPSPRILEWSCYHPPSPTPAHRHRRSISDSPLPIPPVVTNDISSYLGIDSHSLPQTTSTESLTSSYITCNTCDEETTCH